MTAEQAIAEAWASLNGKLEEFNADKVGPEIGGGYYEGYMSDVRHLKIGPSIKRELNHFHVSVI